jgi:hypothetical protein
VQSLEEAENGAVDFRKVDIVYPACDVDLFATPDPLTYLWRAARLGPSVSISTKALLKQSMLPELRAIAEFLQDRGRQLKVGISVSTKLNGMTIERGAAPYEARLRNLDLLLNAQVPSSVVLRPVLQQVPDSEYREILLDAASCTPRVLLGEEYLDTAGERTTTDLGYFVSNREVSWLPGTPKWPLIPCPERLQTLTEFASRLGYRVFQSDADLMADLLTTFQDRREAKVHENRIGETSV